MVTRKQYDDIAGAINEIADEINTILNDCQKEKYLYGIILLYSFIENLLKWLVFVKQLWIESIRVLRKGEIEDIQQRCKRLNFYNAQRRALQVDVVDRELFTRIDTVREERNDFVHQFWLHAHRQDHSALRVKLENLAAVANELVGIFNGLTEEVGVDKIYEVFL